MGLLLPGCPLLEGANHPRSMCRQRTATSARRVAAHPGLLGRPAHPSLKRSGQASAPRGISSPTCLASLGPAALRGATRQPRRPRPFAAPRQHRPVHVAVVGPDTPRSLPAPIEHDGDLGSLLSSRLLGSERPLCPRTHDEKTGGAPTV